MAPLQSPDVPGATNEPAPKPTEAAAAAQDTALGFHLTAFVEKAASEVLGPWKGVCLGENPSFYKMYNGKPPAPEIDPSFAMAYSVEFESKGKHYDLRVQATRAFADEFMLAGSTVTPLVFVSGF
jgi:hypothetical protein